MSVSDPIADMLTAIRNASRVKMDKVDIPFSNLGENILGILKREGYIENFRRIEGERRAKLRAYLKFDSHKNSAINNLKRISKPSLRVYVRRDNVPYVLRGKGLAILSTSKGIMTDKEARKQGTGGEVLCYVW